jgi:antitoxin HicB
VTDLQYPALVRELGAEDGGGYLACAIDLKGCFGDGDTPEEAIANLKDAISEWIAEAKRLGRRIPVPGETIENAQIERKKMMEVIRKQEKLIADQAMSFERSRADIEELSRQISELADKSDADEPDQVWGRAVTMAVIAGNGRHGKDGLQH